MCIVRPDPFTRSGFDFQVYPLLLLQVMDYRKQVARLGAPFRPEHTHETLARFIEDPGKFLKLDRPGYSSRMILLILP